MCRPNRSSPARRGAGAATTALPAPGPPEAVPVGAMPTEPGLAGITMAGGAAPDGAAAGRRAPRGAGAGAGPGVTGGVSAARVAAGAGGLVAARPGAGAARPGAGAARPGAGAAGRGAAARNLAGDDAS